MPATELVLFINEEWNTRQAREAAFELTYSSEEVLNTLIQSVKQLDPDLSFADGTSAVHRAFNLENVPYIKRVRWDRDERWVLRFISDFSFRNTSTTIDGSIQNASEQIGNFLSVRDAWKYWDKVLERMDRRLERLETGSVNSLKSINATYVDSRRLRFATEGHYLAPPGFFTFVEN